MLGFEFDNNSEPYSVYNGTSAITTIIFELINATITTQWAYFIYSAVLGGVAITGCSITLLFDFRERLSVRKSALSHHHTSKDFDALNVKAILNPSVTSANFNEALENSNGFVE